MQYILLNRETNLRREQQVKLISEITKEPRLLTKSSKQSKTASVKLVESESQTSDSSVSISENSSLSDSELLENTSKIPTSPLIGLPKLSKKMTQYLMKFDPAGFVTP